ncbi:hypothetical protein AB2B41_23270 [Marimonas sp. MJW-29]|uniref:MASE1 domain-containing protein n=1 Tax=Sulfitobacter sediminis TaxID=3234186 RepID=A0ABV3RU46_9RHOB
MAFPDLQHLNFPENRILRSLMVHHPKIASYLQFFVIVVLTYVLAHGATAYLITPIQGRFFPEITIFASLMYLPHGVRVLATWMMGWKAFPPLFAGAVLSEYLFTPSEVSSLLQLAILESWVVGAIAALVAFELARAFGWDLYAGRRRSLSWKSILLVGVGASLINSVGQSLVFSGLIIPEDTVAVFATYAVGDIIGLFVCMWLLMLVFRWIRLSGQQS